MRLWLLTLLLAGTSVPSGNRWERLLMSKAYWAKVDWQHFDQNEVFSGLEMKNLSQGFLVKAAQVQYRGAEMQLGLLNRSRQQPRYPFALDFAVEPDKGETM